MRRFALKFIDIMIGIVLGLGFQWWSDLNEPWQYVAFFFVYLNIIDYWIDYSPALKKFPPKNELDFMLDIAIMFSLFLFIYATHISVAYLLTVFVVFRIIDTLWLLRANHQYHPVSSDKIFIDTWMKFNLVEVSFTLLIIAVSKLSALDTILLLGIFIGLRIFVRIFASLQYKKIHFA